MLWPVKWTEKMILLLVCQLAMGPWGNCQLAGSVSDCLLISPSIFVKIEVFKCNENPRTGHVDQNHQAR
jgi:hypothetical protein